MVSEARSASEAAGAPWQPWSQRMEELERINARLRAASASKQELVSAPAVEKSLEVQLRYARAMLLAQLGRKEEALAEHLNVVRLEQTHQHNLNALGLLMAANGHRKAALLSLAEAVKHHPQSVTSRVNLGSVLLAGRDAESAAAARQQFEAALRVDPGMPQAHAGMFYALTRLGEIEEARFHQRMGFERQSTFTNPYHGKLPPTPVLLLVSSAGGNTPIERLIDDTLFETHLVVTDFYDPSQPLPEHRLVINGIGDVDVSRPALAAAERLLAHSSAPVVNSPQAVLKTSRMENALRLRSLSGLVVPQTQSFGYAELAVPGGGEALRRGGFRFPVLLRAPGFHMGEFFVRVDGAEGLVEALRELPGVGRDGAELLAIEDLDARGADGFFRKYRVMMVDGELYPLHLAVSSQWKVHYFSSDMADRPDHRQEEERFLTDMPGVLGSGAIESLRRLQKMLGLDYGGVDFGLSAKGEILLFEANATMVAQHPDEGQIWAYRRSAVDHIHAAVRKMFQRRAEVSDGRCWASAG